MLTETQRVTQLKDARKEISEFNCIHCREKHSKMCGRYHPWQTLDEEYTFTKVIQPCTYELLNKVTYGAAVTQYTHNAKLNLQHNAYTHSATHFLHTHTATLFPFTVCQYRFIRRWYRKRLWGQLTMEWKAIPVKGLKRHVSAVMDNIKSRIAQT
jgi:hypothetical protein